MQARSAAVSTAINLNNDLENSFENPSQLTSSELELVRKIDMVDLKDVTARAAKENKWSESKAAKYELEYRQFLFFHSVFDQAISPISANMDKVWHAHILFTQKYEKDCSLLFGKRLEHIPHTDSTPEVKKDAGQENTKALLKQYPFKDEKVGKLRNAILSISPAVRILGTSSAAGALLGLGIAAGLDLPKILSTIVGAVVIPAMVALSATGGDNDCMGND